MSERIDGTHHITLSTGGAQEDWDFHTRTLGLRPIKKTMLYDGEAPVYHLYYANADMDAGSILTTFPMRQQGKLGRRGSNQVKEIGLSVDESSIDFWADRLAELGVATEHSEVLGTKRLTFAHPCGIPYTLVGTTGDTRRGHEAYGVPGEHGIKGAYAPIVSVIDPEEMLLYLQTGMGADKVDEEGDRQVVEIAGEGFGRRVELVHEPSVRPGTWHFAEGTPHHWAWNVANEDNQMALKGWIEGLGFTDVTEQKDRGYFLSVYNRTPGGALFEYAFTPEDRGFLIDEPEDKLATEIMIPPPFAHLAEEMKAYLEPIEDRD
jgi:glyoxalase family protein